MTVSYLGTLEICHRHAQLLDWSKDQLAPLLPFDADKLDALKPVELAVLDQFSVRFAKLQDAMGARLFPMILELTKEPGELNTFIDKLNRLEKIGAIESVDVWLELREIRNTFAHDYPQDPDERAALLNQAFAAAEQLLQALQHAEQFASRYLNGSAT